MRPAEDAAFGTWAAELISKVLATGQFVPLRVKLMPKDLESVTEGFKRVRGTMMAPSPWESPGRRRFRQVELRAVEGSTRVL
jgi:hypothetical protein